MGVSRVAAVVVMMAALAGCARSISDSGYRDCGGHACAGPSAGYMGDLSAYEVLGLDINKGATDAEIQAALSAKQPISLKKGSPVMVIQSGAAFPDDEMMKALDPYYTVGIFSGIPVRPEQPARPMGAMVPASQPVATDSPPVPYESLFRLAAAKGGFGTVMIYWGVLETGYENLVTKTVSWVPIIGNLVPDQTQKMRIRLTVALIDVRTGQWETFLPQPFEDTSLSAGINRASSDQNQVALLKSEAYQEAVKELVLRYSR